MGDGELKRKDRIYYYLIRGYAPVKIAKLTKCSKAYVSKITHQLIKNNYIFFDTPLGIYLFISNFNTIEDNNCSYNDDGIIIDMSESNIVNNNSCYYCDYGMKVTGKPVQPIGRVWY